MFKKSLQRVNLWTINNNLYNPTLAATVYKWGTTWNIARYDVHYEGFQSKGRSYERSV